MELIQRRLEEMGDETGPMSVRQAASRSRGLISAYHLGNLLNGKASTRISDRIAQGVALAIDVPTSVVYDVARVPRPASRWVLPAQFDRLPEPRRRLVEDLIASMLDAYDAGATGAVWR
jgi:hypothetical protein